MKILALDTATKTGSAALLHGDRLVGEYVLNIELTHSERLLPAMVQLIKDARWEKDEIEGIVVTLGPGSFTGLRIGITTGKTLAYLWDVPLVGVGTLDVLAFQGHPFDGLICPILDARRNEVYTCLYRDLEPLGKPTAIGPEKLLAKLAGERVLFLGDGVDTYRELLADQLVAPPDRRLLRASSPAVLGREKLARGEREDPMTLVPTYLRRSEAEITWERKHGERLSD